eukprot:4124291-Prymnesium_polylepis.2
MCATRARHVATCLDTAAIPPRHDCDMACHARDTAATRSRHGVTYNDFSRARAGVLGTCNLLRSASTLCGPPVNISKSGRRVFEVSLPLFSKPPSLHIYQRAAPTLLPKQLQ